MGITLAKMEAESINAHKLTNEVRQGRYWFQRFDHQPSVSKLDGFTAPTGTAADINVARFRNGLNANYIVKGTQTLLAPLLDTAGKGLDISQDQTDNDGVEYVFGGNTANNPYALTVSPSVAQQAAGAINNGFLKLKLRIADVSGTDDLCIGYRKQEASQANVDDYDEGAWVNVNLGALQVETIKNNAATVTTVGTGTWLDDATHTVEVKVLGTQVRFFYDGTEITGLPAFSFDVGEVLVPFLFFLQATTTPGKVWLVEGEGGALKSVHAEGRPS